MVTSFAICSHGFGIEQLQAFISCSMQKFFWLVPKSQTLEITFLLWMYWLILNVCILGDKSEKEHVADWWYCNGWLCNGSAWRLFSTGGIPVQRVTTVPTHAVPRHIEARARKLLGSWASWQDKKRQWADTQFCCQSVRGSPHRMWCSLQRCPHAVCCLSQGILQGTQIDALISVLPASSVLKKIMKILILCNTCFRFFNKILFSKFWYSSLFSVLFSITIDTASSMSTGCMMFQIWWRVLFFSYKINKVLKC